MIGVQDYRLWFLEYIHIHMYSIYKNEFLLQQAKVVFSIKKYNVAVDNLNCLFVADRNQKNKIIIGRNTRI